MTDERTLIEQFPVTEAGVGRVLGPCPGCDNWQLETSIRSEMVVEPILLEHARECPGLTRIAMENAVPIYPRPF